MRKNIYYIFGLIIFFIAIFCYFYPFNEVKENDNLDENVKVYFLDVGQAESILINSNGKYALIDAGNNEDGDSLVAYLKKEGVESIDYLIGTHAHEDHVGGLDNVIRSFDINKFYMPKTIVPTKTYEDIVKALNDKNIKYLTPDIGYKFNLGNSSFEVMSINDDEEDINSNSIVLKMTYKNISFLFTGDLPTDYESDLLNKNIEVDVLKVAHHGSKYSTSNKFLDKVNAKYAVISCGTDNDYYYPHIKLINRLEKHNMKIYRTDIDKTIIFSTDGKDIKITTDSTKINMEENK